MSRHERKGYVLLITIVVCFFISLATLTALGVVSRYQSYIQSRQDDLREEVFVGDSEVDL